MTSVSNSGPNDVQNPDFFQNGIHFSRHPRAVIALLLAAPRGLVGPAIFLSQAGRLGDGL